MKKGGPLRAALFYFRTRRLFRRDTNLGRSRLDVRSDVLLELREIFLEHSHQIARRLVELRFVLPGLERIKKVRLDALHGGRHGEAEIRIGPELGVLEDRKSVV